MGDVVQLGDTVIFDVNGDRQVFVTVRPKSKVKVGKTFCAVDPLIGCPWGAVFTLSVDGKSLERSQHTPSEDWDAPATDEVTKNNAKLLDDNGSQQLSQIDIEVMRAEGKDGRDIIAALAANSATFATKTEFSQEKYKRKKARKYLFVGTVRRPTAATVCEAYFSRTPAKVGFLRVDSLALLLNLANVGAHARVLVAEACGGLVVGAVLERLGGHGGVCAAWVGAKAPSLEASRQFNFSEGVRRALRVAPLAQLRQEHQQALKQQQQQEAQQQQAAQQEASELQAEQQGSAGASEQQQQQQQTVGQGAEQGALEGEQPVAAMEVEETAVAAGDAEAVVAAEAEAQSGVEPQAGAEPSIGAAPSAEAAPAPAGANGTASTATPEAALQQPPFTSCIIALPGVSPLALLHQALPLLVPSAPFAVHSMHMQPLAEAMDALRREGRAVNMTLQECWFREMQVLPSRTHPLMQMNHGGGYLLSGTTVLPAGSVAIPGKQP